jgi:hypothetical protein
VEESWNEIIQSLTKTATTSSVEHLVEEMKKLEKIEDARNYIAERKNLSLGPKEEKTFKRKFQ